jgi:MoaA/NifB/PqqE/SkfB family radical SAM enzyme
MNATHPSADAPKSDKSVRPDASSNLARGNNFREINTPLALRRKLSAEYSIDQKFADHFRALKQVFLYITDRCDMSCRHCIYKPSTTHFIKDSIALTDAIALLQTFRTLGAAKVTFLGGEPTLYGFDNDSKPLLELIETAKRIGYEYIRLDTNGQKIARLLERRQFRYLDEIAFSLDGFSAATNDPIRGLNTFTQAVENIKLALEQGYRVTITCCAQKKLLKRDQDNKFLIERMISFAEQLGVSVINFHDLFKVGVPMDTWTGNFDPNPSDWTEMYAEISKKIAMRKFQIDVRLPQCFVNEEVFNSDPAYYGYCPVKLGERVMVHPNGIIRICSNLICTGFATARYEGRQIQWDNTASNELAHHNLGKHTPCTNRSRHRKYGDLVPLCFSFKPGQDEFVWRQKICWDTTKAIASFT